MSAPEGISSHYHGSRYIRTVASHNKTRPTGADRGALDRNFPFRENALSQDKTARSVINLSNIIIAQDAFPRSHLTA